MEHRTRGAFVGISGAAFNATVGTGAAFNATVGGALKAELGGAFITTSGVVASVVPGGAFDMIAGVAVVCLPCGTILLGAFVIVSGTGLAPYFGIPSNIATCSNTVAMRL